MPAAEMALCTPTEAARQVIGDMNSRAPRTVMMF